MSICGQFGSSSEQARARASSPLHRRRQSQVQSLVVTKFAITVIATIVINQEEQSTSIAIVQMEDVSTVAGMITACALSFPADENIEVLFGSEDLKAAY